MVIFDGLAVLEIKHLHANGFRPGRIIGPFQGLQRPGFAANARQVDLARGEDFPVTAEHRRHGPFLTVRRTHTDPDLFSRLQLVLFRQEEAADRSLQSLIPGADFENTATLVFTDLLTRNLGGNLQVIQAGGWQSQFHDRPGKDGCGIHDRSFPVMKDIGKLHRDRVPLRIAGGHLDPDRVRIHQVTGGLFAVWQIAATGTESTLHRLISRHETAVCSIQDVHFHPNLIRDIYGSLEIQGLPRRIEDFDRRLMKTGLLRSETDDERAVRFRPHLLLGNDLPIAEHLRRHLGAGQIVPGVRSDPASYFRLLTDEEEFVHRFELQREGRQHEFIHPEMPDADRILAFLDPEQEDAAPLAFRQREGAGDRAEGIRLQLLTGNLLSLRIDQYGLQGGIRNHGGRLRQISLEVHCLELQGITGVVRTTVHIDIAERIDALVPDDRLEASDRHLTAATGPALLSGGFSHQGIIDVTVPGEQCLHRGGQWSKAIQPDRFLRNSFVTFAKNQFAAVQRLAADIVRHIDRIAFRFIPMRQRQGMAVVRSGGKKLSGTGFNPVTPVIQVRKRNGNAVQGVKTPDSVAHRNPGSHLSLSLINLQVRKSVVPEVHDDGIFPNGNKQGLILQSPRQRFHTLAGLGDTGFGTCQFRFVGKILLAVGEQGFVVVRLPAIAVQFGEAQLKQILPGVKSNGAHRRISCQRFQGRFAEVLFLRVLFRKPAGDIITQRGRDRIAVSNLSLKGNIDFILVRFLEGHRTATEQVPKGILPVIPDKYLQGSAEISAQVTVELRMVTFRETLPLGTYIFPALLGGFVAEFAHPGIGHDRLVKTFHEVCESGPQGILQFPVTAHHDVDIRFAGIIEIGRKMLLQRLIPDILEDFGGFLGPVGLMHLFVFRPTGGEDVSVRFHKHIFGQGILSLREEQDRSCRQKQGGEEEGFRFHFVSK